MYEHKWSGLLTPITTCTRLKTAEQLSRSCSAKNPPSSLLISACRHRRAIHAKALALSDLLQMDPHLKVLVITGQHQKESGMLAIGLGAFDFFSKPVNIDELKVGLDRAS